MTPGSQFARHPDPESLNAFTENALSAPERASVVAHLAICSRCRQIAYLARSTEEESRGAAVAIATDPQPPSGFRRWIAGMGWGGWRPALVAATACAVLAAVTIAVLPRRNGTSTPQQAKNLPSVTQGAAPQRTTPVPEADTPTQSATAGEDAMPAPPHRPAAPSAARHGVGRPGVAVPFHAPMVSRQASLGAVVPHSGMYAPLPPTPQPMTNGAQTVEIAAAPPPPQPDAVPDVRQTIATDQVQVLPADTDMPGKPASTADANRQRGTVLAGAGKTSSPVSSGAVFKRSPAAAPESAVASSPVIAPRANAESAALETRAADVNDNVLADKAMQTLLPSGLRPVVTAAVRQQVLAIDSSGALFRSENAGAVWVPVARQWTGQATTLRVMMPNSVASRSSRLGAFSAVREKARTAAQKQAPIFELVNEQGGTWVSDDGKVWSQHSHP